MKRILFECKEFFTQCESIVNLKAKNDRFEMPQEDECNNENVSFYWLSLFIHWSMEHVLK